MSTQKTITLKLTQLEKYRAARRMAQKNPPADATNIRQGQASHGDLP